MKFGNVPKMNAENFYIRNCMITKIIVGNQFYIIPSRKKKDKAVPVLNLIKHYAMKAHGGSGCIDPHFLDLGTSWR
jgi:hypothetical protein